MPDHTEEQNDEDPGIVHPRMEDLEELVALRILAMRPSLESLGRFDTERARERLVQGFDPQSSWIIRQDGRIMAFSAWVETGGRLVMNHLYVHPDTQGKGLGTLLLDQAKSEATRRSMCLDVQALKESKANFWYRSRGFMRSASTEFDHQYTWNPTNPDGLDLRPASLQDAVALQDLMESVWHLSRTADRPERPDTAKALKALGSLADGGDKSRPQVQILAFLPTGHLAGWLAWSTEEEEAGTSVILEDFIIHQAVQGRGIGRRFLAMAETEWKLKGYTRIRMDADVRNWQGLSFLFRNGYDRVVQWLGDRKLGPENHAFLRLEKQLEA